MRQWLQKRKFAVVKGGDSEAAPWTGNTKGKAEGMKKLIALGLAMFIVPAFVAGAVDAKTTYDKDCAKCHGKDGKGDTKMGQKLGAKDYTDPTVQAALTDEAAFKATKEGYKDKDGKVIMKPSEGLSDADIKAMIAYMRTFKK